MTKDQHLTYTVINRMIRLNGTYEDKYSIIDAARNIIRKTGIDTVACNNCENPAEIIARQIEFDFYFLCPKCADETVCIKINS